MARYGDRFKARAVARLLPPESAPLEQLSAELGISSSPLERWRSEALATGAPRTEWSSAARFDALPSQLKLDNPKNRQRLHDSGGNYLYP